uniref:BTB domain-containing protein n=1 Tax=Kalanchoe fedtschenkoi TaxID=63787 RepID=A0A7N0RIK7_KALFE
MAKGQLCVDFAAQKPLIGELPPPDVLIVTSGRSRIPAHGSVLGKMSPVLDGILDMPYKRGRGSERLIPIPGVPCEAVAVFVRFLYSHRCVEEEIEKYGVHLLALSHVYMLPTLKQRCARALTHQLTCENVVDKLKLARLCDAPYLYLKCMKLIANHFKEIVLIVRSLHKTLTSSSFAFYELALRKASFSTTSENAIGKSS